MPRTGSNIYKRKDGRWEGRYIKDHQPSGKAVFGYVYAYSYKEVKAKLNMAISGQVFSSKHRTPGSTFSELSALWLESQQARVKESTYNKYKNILNKYILPDIGSICLQELSRLCVTELCDTLLTSGGQHGTGLSEKNRRRYDFCHMERHSILCKYGVSLLFRCTYRPGSSEVS